MSDKPVRAGIQPRASTKLDRLARNLLEAALAFREEVSNQAVASAVVWVEYSGGALVVVTRGEYRDTIMENIEPLSEEITYA